MNRFYILLLLTVFSVFLNNVVPLFAQSKLVSDATPAQQIIARAIESARAGDKEKTVAALKEFYDSVKEFDVTNRQNLQLFTMAASLFTALDDDKGRKNLYQLAINDTKKITSASQKDEVIKMLASNIVRSGGSGDTLIDMSKMCSNPEAVSRVLILAVLAESNSVPKPKWEDFQAQHSERPDSPKVDTDATSVAMNRVLNHIASTALDIQSIQIEQFIKFFKNEPFHDLFLSALEKNNRLNKRVKERGLEQLKDNSNFVQNRQTKLTEINDLIVKATSVSGGLDILNPSVIDPKSQEFKDAQKLLEMAAKQANELDINDGRGAVLFTIAQTQNLLGDTENAKRSLEIALRSEIQLNTNDIMLEQISNLQISMGDYDGAIKTTESFYSSMKEQPADRVFYSLATKLLAKGEFEKAKELMKKITDETKREEINLRIEAAAPKPLANEFRKWTTPDNKFSTEAVLVRIQGSGIVLKKRDGKEVTVPIETFSTTDRKYILEKIQEQPTTTHPETREAQN
jgi:tetratricopeptide (TPR) repeat protein